MAALLRRGEASVLRAAVATLKRDILDSQPLPEVTLGSPQQKSLAMCTAQSNRFGRGGMFSETAGSESEF